jgi:hypothetical protein
MSNTKSAMLTVKLTPARLEEFRIAAMLRGTTMSALITQFITTVVREEMTAVPEAFKRRSNHAPVNDLVDLLHPTDHNN